MKILIVHDTYFPDVNGASYFTQRLAKHLSLLGHDIKVMAPSPTHVDQISEHDGVTILGVRSFPVERIRVAIPYVSNTSIRNYIAGFNPDIIHVQGHFPINRKTVWIAQELGIPVIGTNHFMPDNLVHFLPIPKSWQRKVMQFAWNDFLKVFNQLSRVTTPTETAAGLIRDIGIQHNVKVISNGIDLDRFNPTNNGDYLKKRYNIPNKPTLLFVGRLDKEKNVDQVLQAMAFALKEVDFHFVVAGSGAQKKALTILAERLGISRNVTFTGFVPDEDLPNLYAIAQCYISPGTAELQSISSMEAMATGLPLIAVNALALPELIHNGENGFLYNDGDITHLSKHLVAMFSNPALRQTMGQKSLEIISNHKISDVMAKFVELYEETLNNHSIR